MPRAAPPRRPVPPARRRRAAPVARWPPRCGRAPDRRARLRRLPATRSGWSRPTASAPARQLTLGARHDHHPRFSPGWPDARVHLGPADADRGRDAVRPSASAKDREDAHQVHLLPLDGGEARRLTDLPRGVDDFEWSPDGTRLVVVSTSHGATARRRRPPPRHRPPPRAGHAAAVRLPVHRPARLHAQRRRVHLRQGRAPLAGRCRDRRGDPADRRPRPRPASRPGRPTAAGSPSCSNRRRDADLSSRLGHPRRGRGDAAP